MVTRIKSSFLYGIKCFNILISASLMGSFIVRIQKNPIRYKLDVRKSPERQLETLFLKDLDLLAKAKLIERQDDGMTLLPTEYGRIMAKYYIRYDTANNILSMRSHASLRDCVST
jgi:ATP-dependent DNA helicase HFM1/MER3